MAQEITYKQYTFYQGHQEMRSMTAPCPYCGDMAVCHATKHGNEITAQDTCDHWGAWTGDGFTFYPPTDMKTVQRDILGLYAEFAGDLRALLNEHDVEVEDVASTLEIGTEAVRAVIGWDV